MKYRWVHKENFGAYGACSADGNLCRRSANGSSPAVTNGGVRRVERPQHLRPERRHEGQGVQLPTGDVYVTVTTYPRDDDRVFQGASWRLEECFGQGEH